MNLLETIMGQLGGETIDKMGGLLGEQTSNTRGAVGALIPFLLKMVTNKTQSSGSVGEGLFNMIKDNDNNMLDGFSDLLGSTEGRTSISNQGGSILNNLLGNQIGPIVEAIAGYAGLRVGSSSSLLKMLAPVIFGALSKAVSSGGLNLDGLINLLKGQSDDFDRAIPAGFSDSLKSFGFAGLTENVSATNSSVKTDSGKMAATASSGSMRKPEFDYGNNEGGGFKKILPWVLLGILGVLFFTMYRSCGNDGNISKANKEKVKLEKKANKKTTPAKPAIKKPVLPKIDLKKLGINQNTNEAKFANLINSGKARIGNKFILNNVQFNSGSTNIKPNSFPQLNNLVKIMKAYPRLKIRLDGHTDSSGDAAKNLTISKQRADAVKSYLISKGITAGRLSSQGYGDRKPIADNNNAKGRAKNRRVEASVIGI